MHGWIRLLSNLLLKEIDVFWSIIIVWVLSVFLSFVVKKFWHGVVILLLVSASLLVAQYNLQILCYNTSIATPVRK